jgi:uncharacterized repeat protein (TIGR01451 family)/LPXTG-motif cell wall-anchored protein
MRVTMHSSRLSAPARLLRLLTGFFLVAGGVVVAQAPAAQAAAALDCTGVYAIQQGDPRNIWSLNLTSGAQTSVGSFGALTGGDSNALGISGDGSKAYAVLAANSGGGRTIYVHTRATNNVAKLGAGVESAVNSHGAVNPANGHYYYGGFSGGQLHVYGFNTQTNESMGMVAKGTVPTGGTNGDWVFDKRGKLYVVGGGKGVNEISVVDQAIPTAGPAIEITASDMATIGTDPDANLNGIAFAGSGYLYVSSSAALFKVNPSSGVEEASYPLRTSGSVDLASCASPTTITVQGSFPDGRVSSGDQTTVTITGNGIKPGTTGTTSGSETGGQSDPAEQAGPVFGLAGKEYTLTQSGPGTVAPKYDTAWECRDDNDGSLITSGSGTTGTFTMPDKGASGVAALCTFTNEAQIPQVGLDKRATLNGSSAGDTVTYDYVVTNTGTTDLATVSVTDDQVGAVTCPAGPLAPNQSKTCTAAAYTLTQPDVDRGSVGGPATVTATPVVDGLPTASASDTETTTITRTNTLTVAVEVDEKVDVDEDGLTDAGDTVAFKYLVSNTGNTTLTGVGVTDPSAGAVVCPRTTLVPGGSMTCTTEAHTVTAHDENAGEVVATPKALATGPDGSQVSAAPATARVVVTAEQRKLTVDSTVVVEDVNQDGLTDAGDTITYRYTLTNRGNVALEDVALTSDLLGDLTCAATTLAPSGTTVCTPKPYVVTEADEEAGTVTNTVSAGATGPNDVTVTAEPVTATTTTTVPAPRLTVAHHPVVPLDVNESGRTDSGDTVRYGYSVTNAGNVPVSAVTVLGSVAGDVVCTDTVLSPDEQTECVAVELFTVDTDDERTGSVTDTVRAEGVDPDAAQVVSDDDTAVLPVPIPAVELEKRAGSLSGHAAGATITYDYLVTNTGSTPLASVSVDDPQVGAVTCPVGPIAVGGSVTCTAPAYVLTQADVDRGTVGGIASVTAVPQLEQLDPVTDTHEASTDVNRAGALEVEVTSGAPVDVDEDGLTDGGDTVTFGYLVTNTGNTTLTHVTVDDPAVGPVTCSVKYLLPGQTTLCASTSPYVIDADDEKDGKVVATATAGATSPEGDVESEEDTVEVEVGVEAPQLVVTHTAKTRDVNNSGITDAGDEITYVITVENRGNVPLRSVDVDSSVLGSVECDTVSLAPGASTECRPAPYVVTEDDEKDGRVTSTVDVKADGPRDTTVTGEAHEVVTTVTAPAPRLTIAVSDPVREDVNGSGDTEAGDKLTYRYTVTNTGNVPVTGVTVVGSVAGPVTCEPTTLEPGASTECAADAPYVVTGADEKTGQVTDLVHATGTDPDKGEVLSDTGTTTVPVLLPRPELTLVTVPELVDTDGDGKADKGETIKYTYTVTNTGNVAITGIEVRDPMIGSITCAVTSLLPGESTTCTADKPYVVTGKDVRRGSIISSATVTGLALAAGGTVESVETLQADVEVLADVPGAAPAPVAVEPVAETGGSLPDTGGPHMGLLASGLLSLTGGIGVLVSRRRRLTTR